MSTQLSLTEINKITTLDTPSLRAELARALTLTAQGLTYLAAIWAELEKRGEDLSDLRSGIAYYLPLIASGKVEAEAVVMFAGQRTVLRHLTTLPVQLQRELASGKEIEVVIQNDDGFAQRTMPIKAMTAAQVNQVFTEGYIRSPKEQLELLHKLKTKPRRKINSAITIDSKTGDVLVGRKSIKPHELLEALSTAYPTKIDFNDEEEKTSISFSVRESEKRAIKSAAAAAGLDMQSAIRLALINSGLLGQKSKTPL